jgi:hypothetical protein
MMLDSHPELAIPPETHFIPSAARRWRSSSRLPASVLRAVTRRWPPEPATAMFGVITEDPHWPDFQLDPAVLRSRLDAARPQVPADGLDVFYALYAERFDKRRWGDKTPPYLDRMTDVWASYPAARFIHIIRDGRDVALSVKDQPFGPNSLDDAARSWVERIERARRQATLVPHYLEVVYEDLVRDPERELRRICDYVRLDWDPAMLRYHDRAAERLAEEHRDLPLPHLGVTVSASERTETHRRLLEPPALDRIGRWRALMSAREKEQFARIAGEMLERLGYPLD